MPLNIVGHLGIDRFPGVSGDASYLGGSLFHFLNGYALSGAAAAALTWTTGDILGRAQARLPSRIRFETVLVERSPEFEIQHNDEHLVAFILRNLSMPAEYLDLMPGRERLHFCAMPVSDVVAVLDKARPRVWSMQLHESVLPSPDEFAALPSAPARVFCNAIEYAACPSDVRLDSSIEWIVTERDQIRVILAEQIASEFRFQPLTSIVDPTGAGDFLAGAVTGALERRVPQEHAVRFGAGVAAVGLSDWSSEAFKNWWNPLPELQPSSTPTPDGPPTL
ncbi:MAG TPA: PfkB family carbohydrate kinase [Pseudolysinimonas sp.]|jgi:hypothetical protein|nr:PfkB family carbohydrate kinase [Pseudolysinimonas sp.]